MKKEAKIMLKKSLDSLILGVEIFNRPFSRGRTHAVLILIDHSFEMFLKASIIQKGGKIRKRKEKQTIGFDECVRKTLSDGDIRFLQREQAVLLQSINSLRDAAQHHILEISEELLYMHVQGGLTLYSDLLKKVFNLSLYEILPDRVLPLSIKPITDLHATFNNEVKEIKKMLSPGKRNRIEANAKIKSLAIIEGATKGERYQPGKSEIKKLGGLISQGVDWSKIFPGVANINISPESSGPRINLRISKKEGAPITLVPEGTPGATVVAVKRVDELGYYNMGCKQLAKKLDLSVNKTVAIIWHLKIAEHPDYFKEIVIGKSKYKRYSIKALNEIKEKLKSLTISEIWQKYKEYQKLRRKK